MKCRSCNVLLNDYESTRKNKQTGDYYDLCGQCYTSYMQCLADITLETPLEMEVKIGPIET